jgi:hypothetical protein
MIFYNIIISVVKNCSNGICWVVIFFAMKEQSFDYLVKVDRLGDKSTDELS